ncbi:MAG: S41 family peptidase, partial [Patescibacteria group bacterium]
GLMAGDKILQIDEMPTAGLEVEEAIKNIRGDVGTDVSLLIMRDGWNEAREFTITRAVITIPTIDFEMKPGKIAYIALHNFNANVPTLFYQTALEAVVQGARGVVLDLRNNPGGFLDVAVNLSGWFLERGSIVVVERFHTGAEERLRARGNAAFAETPVVVLVNGGSASASEILAGALRDNRSIKLIGSQTFGKGSVQEVETLKDASSLKISIAEWLTPKGHKINRVGLTPDVVVEPPVEADGDPQLEKALEVIAAEIAS